MTIPWVKINLWMMRFCFAAMLIVCLAVAWSWRPSGFGGSNPWQSPQAPNMMKLPMADWPAVSRNIFDPTGQNWVTPAGKRSKIAAKSGGSDSGNITGIIDLPGFRGVLADNKFVPLGGDAAGGTVESIENGKITINSSQGRKEIDINQNRKQQIESLNIQIR